MSLFCQYFWVEVWTTYQCAAHDVAIEACLRVPDIHRWWIALCP